MAIEGCGKGSDVGRWRDALHEALLVNQRADGGWPPIGAWGSAGGDVYAAAMMTMALQAPFRDAPLR